LAVVDLQLSTGALIGWLLTSDNAPDAVLVYLYGWNIAANTTWLYKASVHTHGNGPFAWMKKLSSPANPKRVHLR
jgi:hypothetical protein